MTKRFKPLWLLVKSTSTKLLIWIIKFLTFLTVSFYTLYKCTTGILRKGFGAVKSISKRNIKVFWLMFLMLIMLILSGIVFYKWYGSYKEVNAYIENMNNQINIERDIKENLENENNILKEEIEKKDAELQARAEEKAKFAQQQHILANRDKADANLPEYIKCLVDKYADKYGVEDKRMISCIIFYESGGISDAKGDRGAAIGVAQYHIGTFLGHRRQMGLSEEDLRTNPEASIDAMLFSISRGGIGNWTARRSCV